MRALAEELGLRPTKRLGQNFVHDANTVRRIVARRRPGTRRRRAGGRPRARLADPRPARGRRRGRARWRSTRCWPGGCPRPSPNGRPRWPTGCSVVTADALRVRAADLPVEPTALVANLPYNVGVPVVLHLLAELPSLRRGLVMVQAEVAERLAAGPGSRRRTACRARSWPGTRRRGGPGRCRVRCSGRCRTSTRACWRSPGATRRRATGPQVFAVVDAAFAQRRKVLRSALAGWAGSPAAAEDALRAAGIDPTARARAPRDHRLRPPRSAPPHALR